MTTMPPPPDERGRGTGWKRQPIALWGFLAVGAGRIILSGIGLILFRRKR